MQIEIKKNLSSTKDCEAQIAWAARLHKKKTSLFIDLL